MTKAQHITTVAAKAISQIAKEKGWTAAQRTQALKALRDDKALLTKTVKAYKKFENAK